MSGNHAKHISGTNIGDAAGVSRRGRPPLPADIVRQQRIVTFVTAQEKAQLEALSEQQSRSLSAICHQFIAAALKADRNA